MKSFLTFFFIIPIIVFGQNAWTPPIAISGLINSGTDRFLTYSDNNGNHLVINSSGTIRYALLNIMGEVVLEREIDTGCEYDYRYQTIALTADQTELYIVYQKGTKIKVAKSIDAGNSWSQLTEKEMNSSNCNGIDAVYDELGLHIVWAVNSQVYYERYDRVSLTWVEPKHITDEGVGDEGGYPSIALSENRIHIGVNSPFNVPAPMSRTRDYNFLNNEWENSQFIPYQTPPPPSPDLVVVEFFNEYAGKVIVDNNYLHIMEYITVHVVTYPLPPPGSLYLYLYDRKRPLDRDEWEDELLLSKFIGITNLETPPAIINSNSKLHMMSYEYVPDPYDTYLNYYSFTGNNWNQPTKIHSLGEYGVISNFHLSTNNGSLFVYWFDPSLNAFYFSQSAQNPVAPVKKSPVTRYLNKGHYFFEFEPEMLLYSQQKTIEKEE